MMDNKVLKSRGILIENADPEVGYADPTEEVAAREESIAKMQLLWERRRILARIVGVGLPVFVLIACLIPNKYKSTTRLMPPNQNNDTLGMLAALASRVSPEGSSGGIGLGGIVSGVLGLKSSGALFIGILQSRTVQDDLIAKFDLRKLYHDRKWQDARRELQRNTEVEEDRKNGIITVSVTDRSPKRAAAMAREYVDELNREVTQLDTSSAHRERVFLEERLKQVKQKLESAENDFSEFASKNTAIDIPAQGKAMIQATATLEGELIATQTELESLREIYTDNNVRVRTAEARVNELRRQLEKLGGQSDADEAADSQSDQSIYPSIRKLPLLGVTYADLYRRSKIEEAIFETLTQNYEISKVEEAKETPSVAVLDPADVPERKSYPPRLWIILGGTVFSFIAGVTWILGRSNWDRIDPHDPRKELAREVVGNLRQHISVPAWSDRKVTLKRAMFWRRLGKNRDSISETPDARKSDRAAGE